MQRRKKISNITGPQKKEQPKKKKGGVTANFFTALFTSKLKGKVKKRKNKNKKEKRKEQSTSEIELSLALAKARRNVEDTQGKSLKPGDLAAALALNNQISTTNS